MSYYLGIMSGTSVDGIDIGLFEFKEESHKDNIKTHCFDSFDFEPHLQETLKNIIKDQSGRLKTIGETDTELGFSYARAINIFLDQNNLTYKDITAIGCHGQTIFHHPQSQFPFTWQLGNLSIVARETQITTIGNFRALDMAYGGEGAPLASKFHQHFFYDENEIRLLLNLGGIANISCLNTENLIGFDTGPANCLLDLWIEKNFPDKTYDHNGDLATSGKVIEHLLKSLLNDPYFKKSYPKSTGKEYFNLNWLNNYLNNGIKNDDIADIQATLSELSAITIADAIKLTQPKTQKIYLCGGGSFNHDLINRLQKQLKSISIVSSENLGVHPQSMESALMAWLAKRRLNHQISNAPTVTSATKELSLGTIYLSA